MPETSEEAWSLDSADQWGEPYLMLIDESAVILDDDQPAS